MEIWKCFNRLDIQNLIILPRMDPENSVKGVLDGILLV